MALVQSEQKSNITVGQRILAQSAANKTFAAQLTELQTAFNQLTVAQKHRTWIQVGTKKYLLTDTAGNYLLVYTTSAHLFVTEIFITYAVVRRSMDGGAPTDISGETNDSIMYLLIEDDDVS